MWLRKGPLLFSTFFILIKLMGFRMFIPLLYTVIVKGIKNLDIESVFDVIDKILTNDGSAGLKTLDALEAGLDSGLIDLNKITKGRLPESGSRVVGRALGTLKMGLAARENSLKEKTSGQDPSTSSSENDAVFETALNRNTD